MNRKHHGVCCLSVGLGLAVALSACGAHSPARRAALLPLCAAKDYHYRLDRPNGAQGAVILAAAVNGYAHSRECRVHDKVVLRLTDRPGRLLPVQGNPVRTWIGAVIGPHTVHESHAVVYAWRNWCPKTPHSYAYTLSSSAKFARYRWPSRIYGLPPCVNRSLPSDLRPWTDRG